MSGPKTRRAEGVRRTALLMVLTGLVFQLEHQLGLHGLQSAVGFNVLPLLAGIVWLKASQEMLLGMVGIGLLIHESSRDAGLFPGFSLDRNAILVCRIIIVTLCVWITQLRQSMERQQRLLAANNEDLSLQLANSLQASALAHEIRQPLSVIQLRSRELLRHLEQDQTQTTFASGCVEALHSASEQLNRTITAMASLLRSVRTNHQKVDLASVVRSSIQGLTLHLQDNDVQLLQRSLDEPLLVEGDGEQLRIACGNLIRNGIDALQTVPAQQRRLMISLERKGDQVCLIVADSGPGLPPELPALTVHSSSKPDGMGLGLFIAQTIAHHHHGFLRCGRSSELGGAELCLRLPLRSPGTSRHECSDAAPQPAPVQRR